MRTLASVVLLAFTLACSANVVGPGNPGSTDGSSPSPGASPSPTAGDEEQGIASYYGRKLEGHKTASGERYDPDKLTAAHRTLPFGTIVEVTRTDGRSVRVRINDRGPFVKGRVIDLSRSAAKEIGLLRDGVADVTVRVVPQALTP